MISVRFVAMASTFLLVTGALLVGDALHGSVVTAQYPVTSPAAVIRAVVGIVAIAIGYRLKTPVSEYASMPSDKSAKQKNQKTEENGEFDSEMSPLSDEQFEGLDADDEK